MIPFLNEAGPHALAVASSMLWQTALLAMTLILVEVLAGRRLRASVRCGLWLLVIVKLWLPPTLKSPVSPGYWIGRWIAPPVVLPGAPTATLIPRMNPVAPVPAPPDQGNASSPADASRLPHPAHEQLRLNTAGALLGLWALARIFHEFLFGRAEQAKIFPAACCNGCRSLVVSAPQGVLMGASMKSVLLGLI